MRSGHCPKCNSTEIYFSDGKGVANPHGIKTGDGYPMLNVYKDKRFIPDVQIVSLEAYLCQQCGYVEFYAPRDGALARVPESTNWRKVGQ